MTFSLETALNLRVKSVFANATATLGAVTVSERFPSLTGDKTIVSGPAVVACVRVKRGAAALSGKVAVTSLRCVTPATRTVPPVTRAACPVTRTVLALARAV